MVAQHRGRYVPRDQVAVIRLVAIVVCGLCGSLSACTTRTPPPADAPAIRVSYDANMFPNESMVALTLDIPDGTGGVRVYFGEQVRVTAEQIDAGADGRVKVRIPSNTPEGPTAVTVVDGRGCSVTLMVPLRRAGVFAWSTSAGTYAKDCEGPFVGRDGGVSEVCAGYSLIVPSNLFNLSWRKYGGPLDAPALQESVRTFSLDAGVRAVSTARDSHGGIDPLAVLVATEGAGTALYSGDPTRWEDTVELRLVLLQSMDACAATFWHDETGTSLIVGGLTGLFALRWPVPPGEAPQLTMVPPLEAAAAFCGLSAEDIDGDGVDELVASFFYDRPGIELHAGRPDTGFRRVIQSTDVPFPPNYLEQQMKPSFEDLDGDGLLDFVASNSGGGIDAVFMNPDGTAELHRELLPSNRHFPAATAARLGVDRQPYVMVGGAEPTAWRIVSRQIAINETWRFYWGSPQGGNTLPMLVMDLDGDGLPDLAGNGFGPIANLWRDPDEDARRGLSGPRQLLIDHRQ